MQLNSSPTITTGPGGTICAGDSIQLSADANGLAVLWTAAPGLSETQNAMPWATPPATGWFEVSTTAFNGCSASDSVLITVLPAPAAPTIVLNDSQLELVPAGTHQWYLDGQALPEPPSATYWPTVNGSYQVLVTDANGCNNWSEPFELTNVGVAVLPLSSGFTVYPNPLINSIWLQNEYEGPFEYTVVNSLGQPLLRGRTAPNANGCSIDLGPYPAGSYFIYIQHGGLFPTVLPVVKQ